MGNQGIGISGGARNELRYYGAGGVEGIRISGDQGEERGGIISL